MKILGSSKSLVVTMSRSVREKLHIHTHGELVKLNHIQQYNRLHFSLFRYPYYTVYNFFPIVKHFMHFPFKFPFLCAVDILCALWWQWIHMGRGGWTTKYGSMMCGSGFHLVN